MDSQNRYSCFLASLTDQPCRALHTHDFHEFYLCTSGRGSQFIPGLELPMRRGDFFFFPAGQPHYANRWSGQTSDGIVLYMDVQALARDLDDEGISTRALEYITDEALAGRSLIELSPAGRKKIWALFHELYAEARGVPTGFILAIRLLMQSAMLVIVRDPAVAPKIRKQFKPTPAERRIADVCRFVQGHYMENLDIERAASLACMSRSHFHSVFKKHTGKTFIDYLNDVRVSAAAGMLKEGSPKVLEISLACGFGNLSHFYHIFKSLMGLPPAKFAKQAAVIH